MGLILASRIWETTLTAGTGAVSLAGAVSGHRAFSSRCADGDTIYYVISRNSEWEEGLGTWKAGNVLQRTLVLSSSNGGNLVNFSAGKKDVEAVYPGDATAMRSLIKAAADYVTRAALVAAVAAGLTISDGAMVAAEGLAYKGQAGATVLPNLPGLVPADQWTAKHFGAQGVDGDDTAALQSAIAAIDIYGRRLYVQKGRYGVTAALTSPSQTGYLYVYGDGMDATVFVHRGATVLGPAVFGNSDATTGIGTPVQATASAPIGSETLTLASTTGIAAGDYLSLRDKAQPLYGNNIGDICNVVGEIVQVKSIDSPTQVTLYGSTSKAYTLVNTGGWSNNNIDVRKLTLRKGWTLHDFSIEDGSGNIPLGLRTRGISINQTYGLTIYNVKFVGLTNDAVRFENAIAFKFWGCVSEKSDWDAHYMFHGRSGSTGVISDCQMFGGRHLFTTGDDDVDIPVGYIIVRNCLGSGQTAASFDTHDGGDGVLFEYCVVERHTDGNGVTGSYHGFQIRCKNATVAHPTIRGNCDVGVRFTRGATNGQLIGGKIFDTTNYGVWIDTAENVKVSGTEITRAGISGVYVERNAGYNVPMANLLIDDLTIVGPTTNGVEFAASIWQPGFRVRDIKTRGVTNKFVNVPASEAYGSNTPNAAKFTTLDRRALGASTYAPLTSGTMFLVQVPIERGERITKIGVMIGVDAVTPTNFWYALYDQNLAKLGVTNDNGSGALTINTVKELTLAAAVEAPYSGYYYIGIVSVAATPPQVRGVSMFNGVNNLAPMMVGNSTTGLTTPASAPATAGAMTGSAIVPFAYVA